MIKNNLGLRFICLLNITDFTELFEMIGMEYLHKREDIRKCSQITLC